MPSRGGLVATPAQTARPIEKSVVFGGVTVIEDRMKAGLAETLEHLVFAPDQ